jgi:hypothetical protein
MKNFRTYLAAILFIGAITATAFALTDDDPKKQSTETTTKAHCDQMKASTSSVTEPCSQHKETASTNCNEHAKASCDSTAAKHACKEAASTASAECPKAKECVKATASAASTAGSAENK